MSSSVHIDNKNKNISILGKWPTQESDNPALTAEGGYSIDFSRSQKILFRSSLSWKQQFFIP